MADDKPTATPGGVLFGWLKAAVTSVVGLAGGACLMYFSPLLDKVIKPGKPLANFQAEMDGLKVVLHNRSVNASEGWWDFGDGSALEPFQANQDVTHTYTHPSSYGIKLSLRSLFGDENERSVTVLLDPSAPTVVPVIEALDVLSLSQQPIAYAPATFKLVSKVKNADLCVWALGNDEPLDVVADNTGTQERYVTFKQPGTHVIKLAAYGSKQTVEKTQTVRVEAQPAGTLTAVLNVTHQVVHVTTREVPRPVVVDFPAAEKGNSFKFQRDAAAPLGFEIVKARLDNDPVRNANVRAPAMEIAPDRKKVRLSGELVKAANGPTRWVAPVVLTVEQRTAVKTRAMSPVAVQLLVPGTTVLPMPMPQGGWVSKQHSLTLEMRDGERTFWQAPLMPRQDDFTLHDRRYHLAATEVGNQIRIDIKEISPRGARPLGN